MLLLELSTTCVALSNCSRIQSDFLFLGRLWRFVSDAVARMKVVSCDRRGHISCTEDHQTMCYEQNLHKALSTLGIYRGLTATVQRQH